MPYIMKQHQWNIPETEQEAARFIYQTARATWAGGTTQLGMCQSAAFEEFKRTFYMRLQRKLDIPRENYLDLQEAFGIGALVVSEDGTQLSGWRVEKEDAPS